MLAVKDLSIYMTFFSFLVFEKHQRAYCIRYFASYLRAIIVNNLLTGFVRLIKQARYFSCVIEILLSLMYSRIVLMVVCWCYGMPFDANICVSTLMNID